MFGLDDTIAGFSDGTTVLLVMLVAILLGLRHASDPDHLAAVTTLIASGRERAGRAAAKLGLAWGLGHGTTLFIFGLPIVLFDKYLPERALQLAETAIAAVIVLFALRLLLRWRRGFFHAHEHGGTEVGGFRPLRTHAENPRHNHPHRVRKPTRRLRDRARARDGWKRAGVRVLIVAAVERRRGSRLSRLSCSPPSPRSRWRSSPRVSASGSTPGLPGGHSARSRLRSGP